MAIDRKWIVTLKGKDFPTWGGVLDAATEAGLKSLTTKVIQIPHPENGHLAVVMARAEFSDGRAFEDVGDCSPASTTPQLASAALRLASTRAKGRVLRDSINVGQTMFEELPGGDTADDREERLPTPRNVNNAQPPESRGDAGAARDDGQQAFCAVCGLELSKGQAMVSRRRFSRCLCPAHQREQPVTTDIA